ncbi:rod shape-determining protein MreD [Fredinandcohnia sp. QZ13]|uniref:rod shape-determining protein MreD n=1 Tax=Fredinandcohnia sp. QZ13 TaxID=3073144 RepID=UPI0028535140|nr:rod shape-determining protein MreD [Fredinandcohnia sp. QZ13]MDR4889103.1 rod shape-determining protein MreD [Fredinandcohnia sp. QZ13]
MKRFVLPFILSFVFLFESSFVDLVPADIFHKDNVYVPRFLFVLIAFITVYFNKPMGLVYGAIFGLLYDIVYTEILGVYLFLYTLIAYLISWASRILQTNIIVISLLSLIGIIALEFCVFGVNKAIGTASLSIEQFLQIRIVPTLLLNSIFLLVFAYPFKKLLAKLHIEE